jgi:hypothetical protein
MHDHGKMHHYQTKKTTHPDPAIYHTGAKMYVGSLIVGGRAVRLKGATPETILRTVSAEAGLSSGPCAMGQDIL